MAYKIADLIIEMEPIGEILLKQGKSYLLDKSFQVDTPSDIVIDLSKESLETFRAKYPQFTLNQIEYILTGFEFSKGLLDFMGFCLHSSALALDNQAVLFSAPCGTGKSTHARLWQEYFGQDKAIIVNDDKPALRLIDDVFYVYGTPWSGKTDLNVNIKVPLKAIVFIEQSKVNYADIMDSKQAVQGLVTQSMRPVKDFGRMDKLFTLLDLIIKKIPIYKMGCNMSLDAVELICGMINM